MAKKENYNKAIDILLELHKKYPNYGLGKHLSTALADYGDVWGLTDKEIVFALEKYKAELEYTVDDDIEKIIEDGKNIDKMLNKDPYDESDEEEDYYE